MEPITAILELTDRIIDLLQRRKLRKDEYFDEVIEPMYRCLLPVVDDTFQFLSEVERLVNLGEYDRESVRMLREKRQALLSIRIQAREAAVVIEKEAVDPKYADFARDIFELFFLGERNYDNTPESKLSTQARTVDLLEQEMSETERADWNKKITPKKGSRFVSITKTSFEETILGSIKQSRASLELRWNRISASFAAYHQDRYS